MHTCKTIKHMSKIKITTLTPVHVGSGNMLQFNSDFITVENLATKEKFIQIIDDRKILGIIGSENIENWVYSIERKEDTKSFIKRMAPESKIIDYSKRRMHCFAKNISDEYLKECLHNGLGLPYIPGSSIKGAIRTAVMSSLVSNIDNIERKINVHGKINASIIEKEMFGDSPYTDYFKFIKVGDAYFEKGSEIAIRLVMYLNINQSGYLHPIKNNKPQLAEAIGVEETSEFELSIDKSRYNFSISKDDSIHTMPTEVSSISNLFMLVNSHTRKIVSEEIDFWKQMEKTRTGADPYITALEDILDSINGCNEGKECILRLGHGSGWRFITGAWSEELENFDLVKNASRPKNHLYEEYDFPKSRRADEDGDLLGFVKLSVMS